VDETPAYRLGDAEREQVVNLLKTAWSDGRLTMDEFAERSEQAYAARSRHDLDVLIADLPPSTSGRTPRACSWPARATTARSTRSTGS